MRLRQLIITLGLGFQIHCITAQAQDLKDDILDMDDVALANLAGISVADLQAQRLLTQIDDDGSDDEVLELSSDDDDLDDPFYFQDLVKEQHRKERDVQYDISVLSFQTTISVSELEKMRKENFGDFIELQQKMIFAEQNLIEEEMVWMAYKIKQSESFMHLFEKKIAGLNIQCEEKEDPIVCWLRRSYYTAPHEYYDIYDQLQEGDVCIRKCHFKQDVVDTRPQCEENIFDRSKKLNPEIHDQPEQKNLESHDQSEQENFQFYDHYTVDDLFIYGINVD